MIRTGIIIAGCVLLGQPAWAETGPNDSHAVIGQSLKKDLVGKATLDGKPVTDVRQTAQCVTSFSTAARTIAVDWAHVGNSNDTNDGFEVVIPLQSGDTINDLRVPRSDADGIESSFMVLYGDCQPQ